MDFYLSATKTNIDLMLIIGEEITLSYQIEEWDKLYKGVREDGKTWKIYGVVDKLIDRVEKGHLLGTKEYAAEQLSEIRFFL